ncbi:amidohydrolase family protein [uncultured Sphingomonas sp.]|uniref:N-acyl-D-amino-acid deacylase family protein n=1 Tax=uncultured Sphingomonas sp. TaxID=158754 RepID=UPI0035C94649
MFRTAAAALALTSASTALAQTAPKPASTPGYDVIIRGGTVFDGSGRPGRVADVGIVGDRIVAVGDLSRERARVERIARGRYVTPGFVSVHDHSVPDSYARPVNLLTQGITTAITNPDGGGPLDIAKQLARPLGLNYGAYIGFNSVWTEVMGQENRRAGPAEVARMAALVTAGMRAGAFGLSAGLDYKPGFWATTDEVVAVARAAAPWRTGFTNHERVHAGNGYSSMAGMAETVAIGGRAGLQPIVTHMKLQGRDQGKVGPAFALARDAARLGVVMATDAYPYTFGSTSLEQLTIPAWAQDGGNVAMLARFKDPKLRGRIAAETEDQLNVRWGGPGGVYLSEMRRELTDVIGEMGGVRPGEAIIRLLEQGRRRVLLRFGTEADQERIVAHPLTAMSCDCGATASKTGHPRNWGAFPKFMGRYVRERRLVGWPEAVRKMTALPATMIGLAERGYLLPGMIADVTVFDPATVIDRATIEDPTLPSVGVETVLVNGVLAVDAGRATDAPAGRPLARSRHEPGRPMDLRAARMLAVDGTLPDGVRVSARLAQRPGAARPAGTVRVTGLAGGAFAFTPGILQATAGWASVTGVVRRADGRLGAATLFAEEADPQADGRPALALLVDGRPMFDAPLATGTVRVGAARR